MKGFGKNYKPSKYKKKMEHFVFGSPGRKYAGMPEKEVVKAYREMSLEDYDKFVIFANEYLPFKDAPDYIRRMGKVAGRNLGLTVFARQPVIRFGTADGEFSSSSYLFTLESALSDLGLPVFEVVQIEGRDPRVNSVPFASKAVSQFYHKHGWNVRIREFPIEKTEVRADGKRRLEGLSLCNPELLLTIARKAGLYHPERFCLQEAA